ncbi:hypothetical protein CEXT_65671 [Caerostris extrusa]|uniref:Uncharacterized protein n=1 Tax=Caerostris extrusa TaxID=172846 RepID=A0AAV4QXY8_CAEEX|nr:hypothetical protein CEXT_65671 [Caerostris extrusa]
MFTCKPGSRTKWGEPCTTLSRKRVPHLGKCRELRSTQFSTHYFNDGAPYCRGALLFPFLLPITRKRNNKSFSCKSIVLTDTHYSKHLTHSSPPGSPANTGSSTKRENPAPLSPGKGFPHLAKCRERKS